MNLTPSPSNWPCGWLRMDGVGRVMDANPALGRLLGRPHEVLKGVTFDSLLSGPTRVLYHSYLQPMMHLHGSVEEISITLQTAGGGPLEMLFYGARQVDQSGAEHIDVLLAPIRRRHGIEQELLRIKRAADQSPGLIFKLLQRSDGSLHFPYVSDAVRRLYGVTPEAAQQSADAVLDHLVEEDRCALVTALSAAADAGQDWSGVFRVRLADGSLRWHEMHCTPRTMPTGEMAWHGHIADVSARRELERTLAERDANDRANRMRSEFLARVSHELRTPLNGIIGFAELMEADDGDPLTDSQRHRLDIIRASGQHLLSLVNQVLEISTLEAVQQRPEMQTLLLRPALEEAVELVRNQAALAGVELDAIECDARLRVRANALRLRQVLMNLLSNAIKYNRPGGWVALCARQRAATVEVEVTDSGPGLSEAQQAQLFQAFNRLGAQNTPAEGTGLGLVISQHLLALMDGSIAVRSAPGAGSTFTFTLRLAEDDLPGSGAASEVAMGLASPRSGTAVGGKILYVEDNPVNILLMEAIVALRPGVVLKVAQSGDAALQAVVQERPDLLLLDMHLPDTTGHQLLARLRRLEILAGVPAIAVSAAAREEDISAALQGGFADYWTKPLNIGVTLAEIDHLLSAVENSR